MREGVARERYLIVTAKLDPKLNVKGFQAGATLAMRKPFDPEQLIATIKTALALKSNRRPL